MLIEGSGDGKRQPDVVLDNGNIKLYCGDCLNILPTLEAGSVDAVVTSPPYNCGKNYVGYSDDLDIADYFNWMYDVINGCGKALIHAGRIAINVAWWIGKKPRIFTIPQYCDAAVRAGLLTTDKILWVKGNENGLRGDLGTGWGTWMSPSGPSVRCASEPILIFVKGERGRRKISGNGRGECVPGDMSKDEFLAFTTDVWMIQGKSDKSHPAVFPLEIPTRLAKMYTWPSETILDPFMGSGTTGVACVKTGRKFIGIELDRGYFDIAVKRIEAALAERDQCSTQTSTTTRSGTTKIGPTIKRSTRKPSSATPATQSM